VNIIKSFEVVQITDYCSFMEDEVTITAKYINNSFIGTDDSSTFINSIRCPHLKQCQRKSKECELYDLVKEYTE